MTTYNSLRLDVTGYLATVTLDRPPVNAVSMDVYREMAAVFQEISDRIDDIRTAILTGTGKCFCAGRDVKAAEGDPPEKRSTAARTAFSSLYHCAVPVIAAVNGPALGAGFAFVAMCDVIIASEKAMFGLPQINVGLCGEMTPVRRGLNQYQARRLYFSGEYVPAKELYRMGMVDKVVPHEELISEAQKLGRCFASKSPLALRAAKWSANEVEPITDFEKAYRAIESRVSMSLVNTEDHKEAVRAFLEKRPPVFRGR